MILAKFCFYCYRGILDAYLGYLSIASMILNVKISFILSLL